MPKKIFCTYLLLPKKIFCTSSFCQEKIFCTSSFAKKKIFCVAKKLFCCLMQKTIRYSIENSELYRIPLTFVGWSEWKLHSLCIEVEGQFYRLFVPQEWQELVKWFQAHAEDTAGKFIFLCHVHLSLSLFVSCLGCSLSGPTLPLIPREAAFTRNVMQ